MQSPFFPAAAVALLTALLAAIPAHAAEKEPLDVVDSVDLDRTPQPESGTDR